MIRRIVLAGAVLATAASAQEQPGHSPRAGALVPRSEVTRTVARCVVRHDRALAARFAAFDLPPDHGGQSPVQRSLMRDLETAMGPCVTAEFRSITLASIELRGAIAEDLLMADGGLLLKRARSLPPVPRVRIVAAAGVALAQAMFDCAVAAKSQQAAAMLDAGVGTPAESDSFTAFAPALQACVPANQGMHLQPAQVRAWVATALFRRVAGASALPARS